MSAIVNVNGKIADDRQAVVPVFDHSVHAIVSSIVRNHPGTSTR